jgi:alkanesulfonate monooxygenase SsuD/methylene tetrahydromethanopterin reductase-like flavin-dependent oxidoreductase (luciferase family)
VASDAGLVALTQSRGSNRPAYNSRGDAMDVGVGLPNAVRGVDRSGILEWARRAERAGFSSLGTIDRLVYPNYESMIALAAAAAVTERIGLLTDILIAPLRSNTALFAKQAATLDSLSEGRLTLGLAVGGRQDDFDVSGVDLHRRGRIFDRQLDEMRAVWKGDTGVGPPPARGERPGLLIGGTTDVAFRRAAQYADGWTLGGGTPDMLAEMVGKVNVAWSEAGREGKPRTMVLFYFALGRDAEQVASRGLGDYYAFLGDYAQRIVASAAKDEATVKQYIAAFEAAGADEVICFPASTEVDQVDRLAEAALK